MRTWTRVIVATLCGGCGRHLEKGDPVEVREFAYHGGPTIHRVRCDRCAGPAPPDLPEFVERSNTITPTPLLHVVPKRPLGVGLVDWRAKAAGERDPGEEG
jgi:hypothetical protein